MRLKSLVTTIGISSALIMSSFMFTNCTSMITEEQKKQLNELRTEEAKLNQELSTLSGEIKELEREISARENELNKCKKDTEFVKQKLSQWPNVWPDWSPEEEKSEENE